MLSSSCCERHHRIVVNKSFSFRAVICMLGIAWGAGAGYDDNHDDMGGDKHHHHHDGDHHGHRPGAQPFSGFAVNCPDICVATTVVDPIALARTSTICPAPEIPTRKTESAGRQIFTRSPAVIGPHGCAGLPASAWRSKEKPGGAAAYCRRLPPR